MNIKKGDILKYKDNDSERKVLAIYDGLYALSYIDDFDRMNSWYAEQELKEYFIIPEEKSESESESESEGEEKLNKIKEILK